MYCNTMRGNTVHKPKTIFLTGKVLSKTTSKTQCPTAVLVSAEERHSRYLFLKMCEFVSFIVRIYESSAANLVSLFQLGKTSLAELFDDRKRLRRSSFTVVRVKLLLRSLLRPSNDSAREAFPDWFPDH